MLWNLLGTLLLRCLINKHMDSIICLFHHIESDMSKFLYYMFTHLPLLPSLQCWCENRKTWSTGEHALLSFLSSSIIAIFYFYYNAIASKVYVLKCSLILLGYFFLQCHFLSSLWLNCYFLFNFRSKISTHQAVLTDHTFSIVLTRVRMFHLHET